MICARLTVSFGKDNMPLSKFQIAPLFKLIKLTLDEEAVEGVSVNGNKGATPVFENAEFLKVLLSLRWEKGRPIVRVLKLWNICNRYLKRLQNLKLSRRILRALSDSLSRFDFTSKFQGSCSHRHSSTIESKWKQHIFA
jgi:hypothetical protein